MFLTPYSYAYIGIALVLVRYFAGYVWRVEKAENSPLSPFGCFVIGMMGAAIWPVVFAVMACTEMYDRWPDMIMRIFFHEPSKERRERQLKRRREEIARLEKELGMDETQ